MSQFISIIIIMVHMQELAPLFLRSKWEFVRLDNFYVMAIECVVHHI